MCLVAENLTYRALSLSHASSSWSVIGGCFVSARCVCHLLTKRIITFFLPFPFPFFYLLYKKSLLGIPRLKPLDTVGIGSGCCWGNVLEIRKFSNAALTWTTADQRTWCGTPAKRIRTKSCMRKNNIHEHKRKTFVLPQNFQTEQNCGDGVASSRNTTQVVHCVALFESLRAWSPFR